jgi:Na+/H+ antiporter NhaD/arsenite permease-like protein
MELIIALIFIIGYVAIATEHFIKINKAASALLTGVFCWTVYILFNQVNSEHVLAQLMEHLADTSSILFFLLGAMLLVEMIDMHNGFYAVTKKIETTNKLKLLWIISFFTFFLSSVLDNLTTTIVVISLLRKLVPDTKTRLFFDGMVIIAANAGGAWTPIGDVTTTMLWIGNQITTFSIITKLFIPSVMCILVPLIILSFTMKGKIERTDKKHEALETDTFSQNLVFFIGIGALLFVPVFKSLTGLPPFMGILLGLAIMWVVTEILHRKKTPEKRSYYSVSNALKRVDVSTILFFLGILMSIAALESTGQLSALANNLQQWVGNQSIIVMVIGLVSSVIDNVPLVAATQGMYDLSLYPTDSFLWEFLAYCAGTGGSILIIGSAAGVAAMGMEKIDFFWYFKRISLLAAIGYFAGCGAYLAEHYLLHSF